MFCTVYCLHGLGARLTPEAAQRTAIEGHVTMGKFRTDWPRGVVKAYVCARAATRESPLLSLHGAEVVRVFEDIIIRGQEEVEPGRWVKQEWRCVPKAQPFVIAGFDPLDDDQEELPVPGSAGF
jgi:hypothetical protein